MKLRIVKFGNGEFGVQQKVEVPVGFWGMLTGRKREFDWETVERCRSEEAASSMLQVHRSYLFSVNTAEKVVRVIREVNI
jgi:hypothetical protein